VRRSRCLPTTNTQCIFFWIR